MVEPIPKPGEAGIRNPRDCNRWASAQWIDRVIILGNVHRGVYVQVVK